MQGYFGLIKLGCLVRNFLDTELRKRGWEGSNPGKLNMHELLKREREREREREGGREGGRDAIHCEPFLQHLRLGTDWRFPLRCNFLQRPDASNCSRVPYRTRLIFPVVLLGVDARCTTAPRKFDFMLSHPKKRFPVSTMGSWMGVHHLCLVPALCFPGLWPYSQTLRL